MIEFSNADRDFQKFGINVEVYSRWIESAIEEEGFTSGDITFIACSDEFLHNINTRYLSHDYYTDIITFPYSSENTISGDLFISIERVEDNALQFSVDFLNELSRVFIHGILHLCGYNDSTDNEKEEMRDRENYYLNKL